MLSQLQSRYFNLPLSRKILAITALSSFIVLALLCSISVYRDWRAFSESKVQELNTIAQILESNTEAALRFNDPYRAKEYVDSLSFVNDIQSVTLFDANDHVFATYSSSEMPELPMAPKHQGELWEDDEIRFARNIILDDALLGKILIVSNTDSFNEATHQSLLAATILFIGGLSISILLVAWLQKAITRPTRELLEVTREVSKTKDYSHRATKRYQDEIGSLVEGFNTMLQTIHDQDEKLRAANTGLEKIVAERTQDLVKRNEALNTAMEAAKAASVAKSEFLATTSHELRTPLNPIIGYVEILLWKNENSSNAKELRLIKKSAEHLLRLIDDILDFSRIERGEIQLGASATHIPNLCRDSLSLMKQESDQKGLTLDYAHKETEYGEKWVLIDNGRLTQIILNLIGNAIKFTHQGSIKLTSEIKAQDKDAGTLSIEVSDTGIGIPNNQREKLFKPFTQIDSSFTREYGGMGLGLAISKKIVEAMGGNIECASIEGAGSTFRFEIPVSLANASNATEEPITDRPPTKEAQSSTILLVEDEAVNRELVKVLLEDMGYKVTTSVDGIDALEKWEKSDESFDLVLLDISMPRLDGFETAKALRESESNGERTPIIAMTAHARPNDRERCLKVGMDDYLSKPLNFAKLDQVLTNWLNRSNQT